jgi:hypothetical protein
MGMKTIASEMGNLGLVKFNTIETKRDLLYSKHPVSPCTVPVGTKMELYWSEKNPSRVYFDYAGHIRAVKVRNMHDSFFGKFTKMPTLNTLSKWEYEGGFCKTVLGEKVEPDGFGPSGAPSWMLVAGVI